MGLEPTPQEYIGRLVRVFEEVRRVLRDDGTCWVVLGDTYFGSGKGVNSKPSKEQFRFKQKPTEVGGTPKSLALIPSRFAIAMTDAAGFCGTESFGTSLMPPLPARKTAFRSISRRCSSL